MKHLKTILGLREGSAHVGGAGLRYGCVVVLTDSDADGSHIRGLVINFLHAKWPELAKSGFVKILQTPIVRATKGQQVRDFVHLSALNAWAATPAAQGWRLKYFKGLGTWDAAAAKKLLKNSRSTLVNDDDSGADTAMTLAFDKKHADNRKRWILDNVAEPPMPDYSSPKMSISKFVNTDLVNYAVYDVQRTIPSVLDGQKTGQRKVLFTVFSRGYMSQAKEIKVSVFSVSFFQCFQCECSTECRVYPGCAAGRCGG